MNILRHIFGNGPKALLRGKRREEELHRELEDHLSLETEEQAASGADDLEARYKAMRLFGNTARIAEDTREQWGWLWLKQLGQDLRFALRRLLRSPGFSAVAVLTFALGMGANTAILSLVYGVAFKPLPVAGPGELYSLGDTVSQGELTGMQQDFSVFSYQLYQQVRDHTPEFSDIAAFGTSPFEISVRRAGSTDLALPYGAEFTSGNYFQTLGLNAFAGRLLTPDDDLPGASPVVVVSHRLFAQRFSSNPSVVGGTFFVNGRPMTLVGVAPSGFFGETLRSDPPDFWLPLSSETLLYGNSARLNHPDTYWLYAIGRLSPGAGLKQAQAHVTSEIHRWYSEASDVPGSQRPEISKVRVVLTSASAGIASLKTSYKDGLRLMVVFSGLILLVACANISNLLLARAVAASAQTALRVAIGASRSRLVRQFLTEGIVLALLGGIAGVVLAVAGSRSLLALAFYGAKYVPIDPSPSWPALAVTFVLSLANGILFSLAPVYLACRTHPAEALSTGGRTIGEGSGVIQKGFVAVQAALSLVLLVGAGLLTESLNHLRFQPFGFETKNRYVARVNPSFAGYTPSQLDGLYKQLELKLSQISGVTGISFSYVSPLSGGEWVNAVRITEHPGPVDPRHASESDAAVHNNVSTRYFDTMGMHLLRGRVFDGHDISTSRPVAVVTQTFVRRFFAPDEDPIGKHVERGELTFGGDYEIVGVVDDAKYASPSESAKPTMLAPLLQMVAYNNVSDQMFQNQENYIHSIQLRTTGPVPDLENRVREALAGVNQNFVVLELITLDEQVERDVNSSRLAARITTLYGLLALLLASVALYGVTEYAVARRTNEIGIRIALGADRLRVLGMVLRASLLPILAGLLAGIVVVIAMGRLLSNLLYGVSTGDPKVLLEAIAVLSLCALVASLAPAIRAASISPSTALRRD